MRILLADEDTEALDRLAAVVESLGHEPVAYAVSTEEAARKVALEDPDAAIVALHEDDEHALALIEEIAKVSSGPIVALTNDADTGFIARAAERGIDAFAQPITAVNVQGAIEVAIRRHAETERLADKVDQLETALDRRAVIERAKGILMERHNVDDDGAFELLRTHARSSNRKVVDVSRSVLDGHALLPRDS